MSRVVALLACVAVCAAGVVTASSGAEGERSHAEPCEPLQTIQGPLGTETVLATDHISCEKATRILKRYDDSVDPEVASTEGKAFFLGDNFRCGVRKVFYESARARCSAGDPMFRIDYGY